MNRKYSTGEYMEKVEILRKYFDNPAITTDVIVGFPGESEEEFVTPEIFLPEWDLPRCIFSGIPCGRELWRRG